MPKLKEFIITMKVKAPSIDDALNLMTELYEHTGVNFQSITDGDGKELVYEEESDFFKEFEEE